MSFHMSVTVSAGGLYVKDTGTPKGRGVFAARDFNEGELVEECPVIVMDMAFIFLPNEIKVMTFHWEIDSPHACALALGYGSLYNHDNPASLRYEKDLQNGIIRFMARRPICKDEELTINYNSQQGVSDSNEWFEGHKVAPILSQPPRG